MPYGIDVESPTCRWYHLSSLRGRGGMNVPHGRALVSIQDSENDFIGNDILEKIGPLNLHTVRIPKR